MDVPSAIPWRALEAAQERYGRLPRMMLVPTPTIVRSSSLPPALVHVRPPGAAPRAPTRAAAAAAAAASGRRRTQRRSRAAVQPAALARARADRPRVRKRDILPGASVQAIRRAHVTRQGRMRRHGDARRYCMPQPLSQRSRHWRNRMIARRVATCPTVDAVDVIENRRRTYVNLDRQVNARTKTGPWILAAQAAGYLVPGAAFKPLPRRNTPEWREIRQLAAEMGNVSVQDEPRRPVVAGGSARHRVRLPEREMGRRVTRPRAGSPAGPAAAAAGRMTFEELEAFLLPAETQHRQRQREASPQPRGQEQQLMGVQELRELPDWGEEPPPPGYARRRKPRAAARPSPRRARPTKTPQRRRAQGPRNRSRK